MYYRCEQELSMHSNGLIISMCLTALRFLTGIMCDILRNLVKGTKYLACASMSSHAKFLFAPIGVFVGAHPFHCIRKLLLTISPCQYLSY